MMAMDRLGASRLAVQDQDLSCPRPGFEPRRDELFGSPDTSVGD
jgi:hypothetical protein